MTVETQYADRFDYMGNCIARRIGETVRARRRQAVEGIFEFRVIFTTDGRSRSEARFDHRPTPDDLDRLAGTEVEILAIEKRRHPARRTSARPRMLPV